ncbi:MAG: methyltransferase domain-containing protein [Dehalococcoidia bacterium]
MTASACRICSSQEAQLVSREVSKAPESAVYRCQGCDLVYLDPIMTSEDEALFYERDFPTYMEERMMPGGKEPAEHFAANRPEAERRLALVQEHLWPHWDVLEIGSATGYFLDVLRHHVCSITGVEPGVAFAEYARSRGIPTAPSIEALGDARFDAIFLYYVVEHLRQPVDFLDEIQSLLNPGGFLLIEVPNVEDALISTYKVPAFGPFYWQRAHYYYFSPATLAGVLNKAGYESRMYPVQRYDLSNHMVWMLEGKPGGKGRFQDIFGEELESAYAEVLRGRWICDTVFALATPTKTNGEGTS